MLFRRSPTVSSIQYRNIVVRRPLNRCENGAMHEDVAWWLALVRNGPLTFGVGCFRHQLLLPSPYLVLTKPLRLDIQCQRGASVKIGWKYLDD